jgi:hypothetical protein
VYAERSASLPLARTAANVVTDYDPKTDVNTKCASAFG